MINSKLHDTLGSRMAEPLGATQVRIPQLTVSLGNTPASNFCQDGVMLLEDCQFARLVYPAPGYLHPFLVFWWPVFKGKSIPFPIFILDFQYLFTNTTHLNYRHSPDHLPPFSAFATISSIHQTIYLHFQHSLIQPTPLLQCRMDPSMDTILRRSWDMG